MTSTTRSLALRSTGRRLIGALSAAAAVAVVGVAALPAGTAAAAGVHRGPLHLAQATGVGPAALVDPAALTTASAVTYRYDGTRFVRTA